MRAAADYMMGRYRDAHNDLAGASFDADRHAALWRGLTECGPGKLEGRAYASGTGDSPVLKQYPPDWQARARLADAEAALGIGRLELADAALTRLPHTLAKADALEAQLARARIAAAENHYPAAAAQFAAVENGGDERLAVQAIFYHTNAALAAERHHAQAGHRHIGTAALPLARRRAGNEDLAQAGRDLFRAAANGVEA